MKTTSSYSIDNRLLIYYFFTFFFIIALFCPVSSFSKALSLKVLMLKFEPEKGSKKLENLYPGQVREAVMNDLATIGNLNFVPKEEINLILRHLKNTKAKTNVDISNPSELGKAFGVDIVVYGSYTIKGDSLMMKIKVVSVEEEKLILDYKGPGTVLSGVYPIIDVFHRKNGKYILRIPKLSPDKIKKYKINPDDIKKSSESSLRDEEEGEEEVKNPLKEFAIIDLQDDKYKSYNTFKIGFKLGYPIILKRSVGDRAKNNFTYLYFSVFMRDELLTKNLNYELELGYFTFANKTLVVGGKTRAHLFPLTLSILYGFNLWNTITISPKLGLGYMFALGTSSVLGNRYSSYIVGKGGLEIEVHLSEHFSILLDGSILIGDQVIDGALDFYLIPTMGLGYRF